MPADLGGRRPNRSELVTPARRVWLLSIEWAGRTWRFASQAVSVPWAAAGETFLYSLGLFADDIEQAVALGASEPEYPTVSLVVEWPSDQPIHVIAERGETLAGARGELSLWIEGGDYTDRHVIVAGVVLQPEYGEAGEPVVFTLDGTPTQSAGSVIDAGKRITVDTWANSLTADHGRPYPVIHGEPGVLDDGTTVPAVPLRPVTFTGSDNDYLVFAEPAEVGSARLWYIDDATDPDTGDSTSPYALGTVVDSIGQQAGLVDVSGETTTTPIRTSATYWLSFDDGPANDRYTAGALIRWALERSAGVTVDWARVREAEARLSRYIMGGYVDSDTEPLAWLADAVLPLVPVSMFAGPRGIYPIVWEWNNLRTAPVVESIDVQRDQVDRVGRIAYESRIGDIRNEFRIKYALNARHDTYTREHIHKPQTAGDDPDQSSSYAATVSALRYGPGRVSVIEAPMVYRRTTASAAASWMASAFGFAHRIVELDGAPVYGHLTPGDVVEYTDSDVGITAARAHVVSVIRTERAGVRFRLRLVDKAAYGG